MNGDDSGCYGKKKFPSYYAAQRSASKTNRRANKARMNMYRCTSCRFYHTGNTMHSVKTKEKYRRGQRIRITD